MSKIKRLAVFLGSILLVQCDFIFIGLFSNRIIERGQHSCSLRRIANIITAIMPHISILHTCINKFHSLLEATLKYKSQK